MAELNKTIHLCQWLKCLPLKERFVAKVKRVYQELEEFSCEANYEFFSEQDMIDAKWSERLSLNFRPFP